MGQLQCHCTNEDGIIGVCEALPEDKYAVTKISGHSSPKAKGGQLTDDNPFEFHRLLDLQDVWRFEDLYELHTLLGQGSFGDVYLASSRPMPVGDMSKSETRRVAVKVFALEGQKRSEQHKISSFKAETSLLSQLYHPHIVQLLESFSEVSPEGDGRMFAVMEHCDRGDLFTRILDEASKRCLDEEASRHRFGQMLLATSYLLGNRIVHGDIKPENFLLKSSSWAANGHHEVVKLCDFGSAVHLPPNQARYLSGPITPSYAAPEVHSGHGASLFSDSWSMGVVLYSMLVGSSPFRWENDEPIATTKRRILERQINVEARRWQKLSADAQGMVFGLLTVNEQSRLSGLPSLKHAWFSSVKRPAETLKALRPGNPMATKITKSLQVFESLDDLQRLILLACARLVDDAKVPKEWHDLFLDTCLQEALCRQEITAPLGKLTGSQDQGLTYRRIEGLVASLDVSGSGSLCWTGWCALAMLSEQSFLKSADSQEPLASALRCLGAERPWMAIPEACPRLLRILRCYVEGRAHGKMKATELIRAWATADTNPANGTGLVLQAESAQRAFKAALKGLGHRQPCV